MAHQSGRHPLVRLGLPRAPNRRSCSSVIVVDPIPGQSTVAVGAQPSASVVERAATWAPTTDSPAGHPPRLPSSTTSTASSIPHRPSPRLHAQGKHVVCYVEVGAAGNYYSASQEGISTTYYDQLRSAGEFGDKVPGYPEYYLNIQSPGTVSVIESMIAKQCAAKGFDAVETDIDEEYADGNTGFRLTKADEEQYMTTLADYMHGLGLGWWIKNPDDTGDRYASDMFPLADAVLTEQCNQYSTCGALSVYVGHKAVFNAEYRGKTTKFCTQDDTLGFNGAKFNLGLTGVRKPCR